jgi:hypothetical protein
MIIKSIQAVVLERVNEASDAARTAFRDAILPIYGASENGCVKHIGSSILLHVQGCHYFVTAAHVIDWKNDTTLYLGCPCHRLKPLQLELLVTVAPNGKRDNDRFDFSFAPIDSNLIEKLSGVKFITEAEISGPIANTDGRIFTCLGYPNSKNKIKLRKDKNIPRLGCYTSIGKTMNCGPGGVAKNHNQIRIAGDTKYSLDDQGNRISSISLPGFSGGAIIDVGQISADKLHSNFAPKLAAVFIEVKQEKSKNIIIGTCLTTILGAISNRMTLESASKA